MVETARMTATLACAICGRLVAFAPAERPAAFPFCSERCRLIDLGRWADGRYVIEGEDLNTIDDARRLDRDLP